MLLPTQKLSGGVAVWQSGSSQTQAAVFWCHRVLIQIRNALDPPVGYACGVKQLRVDALVAFAGARFARQAAFGAAVVQTAVVFQLVELLVVQSQRHRVFRAVGFGLALSHSVVHEVRHRGACGVADGDAARGT